MAQTCSTMGWFCMRSGGESPNEAALFRMEQGKEVGHLAQKLYPGGGRVFPRNNKTASEATQDLLADQKAQTLFEAEFTHTPFVARADILDRYKGGWHVLEVKSSFADTKSIDTLIDDLAYTVRVMRRTGLEVTRASLVLLSRDYRHGDTPDRLFEIVDQTAEVNDRVAEFDASADLRAAVLLGDIRPRAALSSECRDCNYFENHCLGKGLKQTVLEIPGLHYKKLQTLSSKGIVDLAHIPEDLDLNDRRKRAREALAGQDSPPSHIHQSQCQPRCERRC